LSNLDKRKILDIVNLPIKINITCRLVDSCRISHHVGSLYPDNLFVEFYLFLLLITKTITHRPTTSQNSQQRPCNKTIRVGLRFKKQLSHLRLWIRVESHILEVFPIKTSDLGILFLASSLLPFFAVKIYPIRILSNKF